MKSKSRLFVRFFISIFAFASTSMIHGAEIVSFYPTGSVKKVQQVNVRFSADMVAMGDPRSKNDPLSMTCNKGARKKTADGTSAEGGDFEDADEVGAENVEPSKNNFISPKYMTRWADSKNWVLEFESPLVSGISCSLKINPNARDLSGEKIQGLSDYSFSTAGPAIVEISPRNGEILPEQSFIILVEEEIDQKSVEEKAYFEVENLPEKISVKIIRGSQREALLKAEFKKRTWKWSHYHNLVMKNTSKPFSSLKEMDNFLVLSGNRRFPEDAKVVLHWPKGILSKSGLAVEEPQSFTMEVVPPFTAIFNCERSNPDFPCNPISDMNVRFSRPLPLSYLKDAKLVSNDGKTWIPNELLEEDPQTKNDSSDASSKPIKPGFKLIREFGQERVESLSFSGPFPESKKFKLILGQILMDDLGRPLSNQGKYPLEVGTDEFPPLIKFPAHFGILELTADPVLPVSVRNVEKKMSISQVSIEAKSLNLNGSGNISEIIKLYEKVSHKSSSDEYYSYGRETRNKSVLDFGQGLKFEMPKPLAEKELELVGIPLKKAGFYVIEMASPRLGQSLLGGGVFKGPLKDPAQTMYVATSALVTDMAVHIKKGRESSLVWVTQLSNAKPVNGAEISVVDENGSVATKGKTDPNGILQLDLPNEQRFYVFAKKGDDLSFASSTWDAGIERFRFDVSSEYLDMRWGPVVLHSVLDRTVAQPSDTIHMKHVLREHRGTGFAMIDKTKLPKRVLVVHEGSQKTFTLPFTFEDSSGTALNTFLIPPDAPLGRYSIYLSNKDQLPAVESSDDFDPYDWSGKETGHFLVTEYRLPLMKSTVKILGDALTQPTEVKVDLSAHYLAGGPAKGLKVKLRSQLQPASFKPDLPGGGDFNFLASPIQVGLSSGGNKDNQEASGDQLASDQETQDKKMQPAKEDEFLAVQELTLNAQGGQLAKISGLPEITHLQELSLEMEYTDPNGEVKTSGSSVKLFPADYLVGLRPESWYAKTGKIKVSGVITDIHGRTSGGRYYVVEAFKQNQLTHRKRVVGGFYSYDSTTEVIALGQVCSGKSDALGFFTCETKELPAGDITLQAKTVDEKKRATYASAQLEVFEAGVDRWWIPSDSDRIDLLPEKIKYDPSEKAKLVVRSPFPTSTVLVTVEREGVLDSFVTEVSRDNPMIEVPMKPHYAPNVFISVMALRGRVGDPKPTALIDLAKPSMKMGLAELKVGWKGHELLVTVKPDKPRYKAKEKAQVTIQVRTASGAKLPQGSEVAVAAVDEALLRLKQNTSWNLLQAMMGQRGLAVRTASGQNQVIGRRHFGAKAKAPGGGGGTISIENRENFDPMLLWQPRLKLDSNGEAKVTVPLNDSMTSFRIVAIANAGDGFFGDGSATIESTKDLIIYSGFAPLVREGDEIGNAFTLRNTTERAMKVSIETTSKEIKALPAIPQIDLLPSEAKTLTLPLSVPMGLKEIAFQIKVKDTLGGAEDGLSAKVRVEPAVPVRVLQATMFQLDKNQAIPVRQPSDAIPGRGGLAIQASASLVKGLLGVKSYMEDYPYSCLEQKTSKSIVLQDKTNIEGLIESLPSYIDSDGLLKFFPSSPCGSAQLTRYVVNILGDNGYEIPPSTIKRLMTGMKSVLAGNASCLPWWSDFFTDQYAEQGKILLMETLSRHKAFTANLVSTVQITPNLWQNETVAAWYKLLKRQPEIPSRDSHLKRAENIIRARVNFQGSLMNLQGGDDWLADWLLFTSRDGEAISFFGLFIDEPNWGEDVGRMARGIIARLRKGIWDTTMANAWGVTQLRRFSAAFEKEKVGGETAVTANEKNTVFAWSASPKGEKKVLDWPEASVKGDVPVKFSHNGDGKPWIHLQTVSAIPLKSPLEKGYRISRKITPVLQSTPGSWKVGDVANVELTITAKSDQAWVVVRDPIPAGASHLGAGLDGASNILDRTPKTNASPSDIQWWPSEYEEKSNANFVSYAAYLPRGTYRVNYRIRLNSVGEFKLPPTRVEAMYSQETFGEVPNANWKVAP